MKQLLLLGLVLTACTKPTLDDSVEPTNQADVEIITLDNPKLHSYETVTTLDDSYIVTSVHDATL